jgi:hypothetical protein
MLLFGSVVLAADNAATAPAVLVDNPAYVAWAKAKVGASITYKMEMAMTMEGLPQPMKNDGTVQQTLKEIKPESVTVDVVTSMSMNGQALPPQSRATIIPAKIEKGKEYSSPEVKGEIADMKTGKDSVEVGGKKYDTETREFTMKMTEPLAMTSQNKIWTSPEVPGGMVKTETRTTTPMNSTMTMTLIEVK